jgi:protein-disulfide isomerase
MNGRSGDPFERHRARGLVLAGLALTLAGGCDGALARPPTQAALATGASRPACPHAPGNPPCQGGAMKAAEPAPATETSGPVLVGRSPARGPADAPITLVLFSDFQCPYCARVEATLDALEAAYPGKIRVVWKHFPLEFHPEARGAARAAVAAGEQGKFWEMQARLLGAQSLLAPEELERHALALGLDAARFRASLQSPATDAEVEADLRQGRELGVSGTPVLFINRRKLVGAQPLAVMRAAVDEELARLGGAH